MDGTPNAATFGSSDPNTVAYGNNPDPNAPMSNVVSPMVQQLQNFGRNNDSQLVHMTPGEVGGLQALAQAHGGSLTTNPVTGLPEAGFLENILPTLLGVGLSFIPGVGPLMAAGITGLGTTAVTGDLKQGLMAGLGAFGGASLAGGLGIGAASGAGTTATNAATQVGTKIGDSFVANQAAAALPSAATSALPAASVAGSQIGIPQAAQAGINAMSAPGFTAASSAANPLITPGNFLSPINQGLGTFGQKFAQTASGVGPGGAINTMKTGAAAMGVANPLLMSLQPEYKPYEPPKSKWNYEGPYKPQDRKARFPTSTPTDSEFSYFEDTNPYPGYLTSTGAMPEGFADGGSTGPVFSQTTGGIEPGYTPQAIPQPAPQAAVNPAQFSAVQAAPMASIFAPSQVQTYRAAPQVSGAGLAQLMMPQGQQFLQSMEHAKTAGPMKFEPFKTEKETIDAAKAAAKTTTPTTTTPTTTTTTTTPTTGPVIQTPNGGGNDIFGGDFGYTGNGTEALGDPSDAYYNGFGGRPDQGTSTDTTTWVDPNIDPSQWDPNVDYTGGVDLSGLDFSNIGGSGGSYQGNPEGYDAGQNFVNTMDLSGLQNYSPEQFQADLAAGNYGGSDINGNPFNGSSDAGGLTNDVYSPSDYGMGPDTFTQSDYGNFHPATAIDYGNFQPTNTFDYGGFQPADTLGYGSFGPAQSDYGSFQPASTFDYGSYSPSDYGMSPDTFAPSDFGSFGPAQSDYGSFQPASTFDYGSFAPSDFGNFAPADYGNFQPANTTADMYSPSDYYGMDTGGGFNGIGNDFGFDQGDLGAYAAGGQVPLEDGAFIVDARTVSELGNGSSRAGQDLLAKYGGKTLHGPGDGVSDSIKANIGGVQDARVARDEVKFSPQAVAKIGGGDLHKGTKKLYAMMDRAQKARQSAQRGQNTGLQGILNR